MQTEQQKKKRKIASAVGASLLAVAIAITGTYAWQSISQKAKNIAKGDSNPGGRLHDYFNGENKDVFVENFTDPKKDGVPIFIRVRLDEYMEIGPAAGKADKTEDEANRTKPLVVGADINDVTTWTTYIPTASSETCENGAPNSFHKFWSWNMGGESVFMPTFNKNKDSLKADVNGTYEGQDSQEDQGEPYDDFLEYAVGDTKEELAVYDADDNDFDEGAAAIEGTHITTQKEKHTAKATQTAKVITMEEWKNAGSPKGKYWVYDVDGWAYWAEGLEPGEATGLLLDGIALNKEPGEKWFYGINVVGQFVTRGDWGDKNSKTGFFADDAGAAPTDDAIFLLKQAADLLPKVTGISFTEGGNVYVKAGESVTLNPKVKVANATDDPAETAVNWSIDQAVDETVFKDGVFTSTEAMKGITYQVTAISTYDPTFSATANIYVYPSEAVGVVRGQDGKMYVDYGDNTFKEILTNGTLGQFVCAGRDETIGNEDDTTQVVEINPANETYGNKFIGEEYDYGYWAPGSDGKLGTADDIKVWGHDWPDNIDTTQPTIADTVTVAAVGGKDSMKPGETLQFSAVVSLNGTAIERGNVSWSVSGAAKAGTKINENGLLTVDTNETAKLTIRATSLAAHGVWGETAITIIPNGIAGIEAIEPGSTHVANIDGIEWYVLAKDGNKALLWSKEMSVLWGAKPFGNTNNWKASSVKSWLNNEFITSLPTLKNCVVPTTLTTRVQTASADFDTTTDKAFLLSEADIFGTNNRVATNDTRDYTFDGKKLVTNNDLMKCLNSQSNYIWLRSPVYNENHVSGFDYNGNEYGSNCINSQGIRPAMWVTYK